MCAPGGRRIAAGAEGGRRPSAAGPRRLPGCPGSQASGQRAGARAVAPAAERRWLWRSAAAWRAAGAAARRGGEGTAGRRAGAAPGGGRRRSGRWAWATWATRRGPRPVCTRGTGTLRSAAKTAAATSPSLRGVPSRAHVHGCAMVGHAEVASPQVRRVPAIRLLPPGERRAFWAGDESGGWFCLAEWPRCARGVIGRRPAAPLRRAPGHAGRRLLRSPCAASECAAARGAAGRGGAWSGALGLRGGLAVGRRGLRSAKQSAEWGRVGYKT